MAVPDTCIDCYLPPWYPGVLPTFFHSNEVDRLLYTMLQINVDNVDFDLSPSIRHVQEVWGSIVGNHGLRMHRAIHYPSSWVCTSWVVIPTLWAGDGALPTYPIALECQVEMTGLFIPPNKKGRISKPISEVGVLFTSVKTIPVISMASSLMTVGIIKSIVSSGLLKSAVFVCPIALTHPKPRLRNRGGWTSAVFSAPKGRYSQGMPTPQVILLEWMV